MKASFDNLKQKSKPVVFETDEVEFGDMSKLKALLPPPVYQNSKSDGEILFQDF